MTNDNFLKKAKDVHKDRYIYLSEYNGSKSKVEILCKKHGIFFQRADIHLKGSNCPKCIKDSNILTNDEFIRRANQVHNGKYLYLDSYINSKQKINIFCETHGMFLQTPNNHLSGKGCPSCAISLKSIKNIDFIKRSNDVHKNRYLYNNYKDNLKSKDIVTIICKKHGEFTQRVDSHLKGHGCTKCVNLYKKSNFDFIRVANDIHNYIYDYSNVDYINSNTKIIITCRIHGNFQQAPNKHLLGRGCPKCGKKFGVMENSWLDSLNINERQVRIGKYIVDGFDPLTNTIYEFNGDFWHGNPSKYNPSDINYVNNMKFGDLYEKTVVKENYLKSLGYNVVSIWESDFNK